MLKITKCTGEGQGSCKRCTDNGKWNRTWMCFLNNIEGYEGCYCNDCTKEIAREALQEHIMSLIPETIDTDAGTHIYLLYQERLKIAKAVTDGLVGLSKEANNGKA